MNLTSIARAWRKAAVLSCVLTGSATADILLIENQAGFGVLAANLRDEGYTVTVRNGEFANGYNNFLNADFLNGFSLIIYGERENTPLPAGVSASLEAYIQAGGHLLVTGADAIGYSPVDLGLANLVRGLNPADLFQFNPTWEVASMDHPIINGPFGDFRGQVFNATGYIDNRLDPDTTRGAIELVSLGSPRVTGRIIFTNLPGAAGSVGYWNGGSSGAISNAQPDFTDGGNPEAIFRNYVAFTEGAAPGFDGLLAGEDIRVGDSDGDGFVTQVLDGSGAAQVIGDIVSWSWTWPGGSATGERPEVTLPANNTLVTVTLTVTDGAGATSVDTVQVTAFTKTAGLFTDFADSRYSGVDSSTTASRVVGTLQGDTLVIDPIGPGVPDVFRRTAGVWTASPFTESVTDIRAIVDNPLVIDDTTLVSGSLATGTDFKVHRLVAGVWTTTPLDLSVAPPIFSRFDYAFDSQSVVFADLFNNTYGSSGGRVFAYDWPSTGNDWNHTELLPPGGGAAGARWGEKIAVDGDLVAVIGGLPASGESLKLFRKSGNTWTLETPLGIGPDPANPTYPDNFSGALSIGSGVVVTAVEAALAGYSVVHEKIGGSWVQTGYRLEALAADFNRVLGVDVDDDGLSFAAKDSLGNFLLYQRDPAAASWAASVVEAPRRLPLADLHADPNFTGIHFSGGEIVVSDPVSGVVRIFDKDAPFDTVNAAPKANAGDDIATTSFDGQPVFVFLNGLGSTDANYEDHLEAEWTWVGGSASGLFTFAMIDPSVTSVELKITDSRGAVSRDTMMLGIDAPPVVDPGDDVFVVDSDGDGIIRLNVSAELNSSDTVTAWSWSWPGGLFSGQEGEITLGNPANGQPVNLTAINENGLSSQTSFNFSMLSANPAPVILQPTGGGPTDKYGAAAAIQNGIALIGAPDKPFSGSKTGASYLAQNLNGLWPQVQLAPGTRQGDAVLIDGDFAFVGAKRAGNANIFDEPGRVVIYKKSPSGWQPFQTLTTPSGAGTFGSSLAKSGNQLLVGAPQTFNGVAGAGAAFLYGFDGTDWDPVRRFDPPTAAQQGRFGTRVAIAGDVIAISQPGFGSVANPSSSTNSSVVTFEKVDGSWDFESEFVSNTPSPPQSNEDYHFGQGLGLSASELLIGSPLEGVVYRRTRTAGNWGAATLINPNRYFFGSSIAMKDDVAVVGAVLENVGLGGAIPGSVTSLILKNGSWIESGYLNLTPAIDPRIVETPNFSAAVAFDGKDLIVGAPTARNSGGVQTGKAYIYRNFAGLNPNANFEPLADAGEDIQVTDDGDIDDPLREPPARDPITNELNEWPGSEEVLLDGSASTDQEDGIVSYEWTWPGGSASGADPEDPEAPQVPHARVRFPVGTTVVTLTVTDDKGIVNSDTVNVTVAIAQTPPDPLPSASNTLTVNLPVPGAKWRLSSEFLWHASGETADDVVISQLDPLDPENTRIEDYQLEIIGYPGSAETVTTFVTVNSQNTVANLTLLLPLQPAATGSVSFPETAEGFSWRLRGEPTWRDVTGDGPLVIDLIEATLPTGDLIIDYRPVTGYATPASQLVNIQPGQTLALDWSEYQRLDNFVPAKTFDEVVSPNLSGNPYQYVGMIRTPLGRGSGTVVAPRVVLTAAHLFFDSSGLQWVGTQWFPRQQQGERQAPPVTPRRILYETAYAQIVAPDYVSPEIGNDPVTTEPADKKEADFAVLVFSGGTWIGGSANYLQSTGERNWLTGTETKQAVGYAQRSQQYEDRGKIFGKTFATALSPVDSNPLPKLYETGDLFGDGGASGSALFVQPQGVSGFYPAAILLAGQDRAVYRVIDQDVGRMIQDAQDAASASDQVLNNNFSLVTYGGSGLRALKLNTASPAVIPAAARWAVKPNVGTTYSNLTLGQTVGFSSTWASVTVSFTAVAGYVTPSSFTLLNSQVPAGAVTAIGSVIYEPVSGFDLWKQSRGITSDEDDRDRDGRGALIEYALNGNPDSGSDPAPIRVAAVPLQSVSAEFEVFVSSTADGIRYQVKASDTLPPTNIATLATFTKADGTNGYKRVVDSQPRSASPRRFAWVEITHDRSLSTGP